MSKHRKVDAAVNSIVGPTVAFKPTKKSIVPGETIGYESNLPSPGTIGKDVQRKPGFKQIALFRINPDKNRPKKQLIVHGTKLSEAVNSLEAETDTVMAMQDTIMDLRRTLERLHVIDVADDKALQQAMERATSLLHDVEQGKVTRGSLRNQLQVIVGAMRKSDRIDVSDDELYQGLARKYNLNV